MADPARAQRPQQAEQRDRRARDDHGGERVQRDGRGQQHEEGEARRDQARRLQRPRRRLHHLAGHRLLQLALAIVRLHRPGGAREGVEQRRAQVALHVGGDPRRQDRQRELQQQAQDRRGRRRRGSACPSDAWMWTPAWSKCTSCPAGHERRGDLRDQRERARFGEAREDRADREHDDRLRRRRAAGSTRWRIEPRVACAVAARLRRPIMPPPRSPVRAWRSGRATLAPRRVARDRRTSTRPCPRPARSTVPTPCW